MTTQSDADGLGSGRSGQKRMLVVVNPFATTVSHRLRNLVIYALRSSDFKVTSVETEAQNHATELCREAVENGYDLVVAFGGDGTVNEAANGLANTNVPLSVLPGGSTSVFCRSLGISNDIVIATEHLLEVIKELKPWKADLGCVNGRFFTFGSGVGLDAEGVTRIDRHPGLKAKAGELFFAYEMARSFNRYKRSPPRFLVKVDGEAQETAVTAVIQNTTPYAYFGKQRLDVCENVSLDSGTLSYSLLTEARLRDLPGLSYGLLSKRSVHRHGQIEHGDGVRRLSVHSIKSEEGGEPPLLPVHVDGENIGSFAEVEYSVHPGVLTIVA